MDFWISITTGGVGSCSSEVVKYVANHLQSPMEAGCLARLPNYRDEAGLIRPHLHNLPLWCQVGHIPGTSRPQPKLLWNLCMGMDLVGKQLTQTQLFQGPVEAVITLPSELSQVLEYNPQAAYQILVAASSAYLREMELFGVSVRIGARRSECRQAQTLTLAWFHARNKAGEPHFQSHVLTFAPALYESDKWHAYVNRQFMKHHLHGPGGARERVTEAVIAEAARHGYLVEVRKGKANPDRHHGARVTCPDGLVIAPGSIPRRQGAEVHARQALWLELGAPWLTTQELQLVLKQNGKYPTAAAAGQRQDLFLRKLEALQLLDAEGRITWALLPALARLDAAMARVEASLRDLPFQEADLASMAVRARREELRAHVPEICTDDWQARQAWTIIYDELLERVATKAFRWADLPPATQNTLHLLARAGVLMKQWEQGWPVYRLTEKGEVRRQAGLKEAQDMRAVVPELFAHVTTGQAQPAVIVGRLQLAGVHVSGSHLEFRRLGRVMEAGVEIREAGIGPSTPFIPDFPWWQWYWDHRHDLPSILARVVLSPEELPTNWPEGPFDSKRPATARTQEAKHEPIYCETGQNDQWNRTKPLRPQRNPDISRRPEPQAKDIEKAHERKR